MGDEENVKVAIRSRPLIKKERDEGCVTGITVDRQLGEVYVGHDRNVFAYDFVFPHEPLTSQGEIFTECVNPLLDHCFTGFNVTVLAYGQTGSGKTHTMGTECTVQDLACAEDLGIIPRVVNRIFEEIDRRKEICDTVLRVSFVELYKDDLKDLFNNKCNLKIQDLRGQIAIPNLTMITCQNAEKVLELLERGSSVRSKGATKMNEVSSRSHAIFTLYMKISNKDNEADVVMSKVHLIDLAGSERLSKTGATGERMNEGININLGLFHLGRVIEQLTKPVPTGSTRPFIGYNSHNLTKLLKDSLGGNSHTLFIACVSPADSNTEETLSTLRYAEKASKIKNQLRVNRDPVQEKIYYWQQRCVALENEMAVLKNGGTGKFIEDAYVAAVVNSEPEQCTNCVELTATKEVRDALLRANNALKRQLQDLAIAQSAQTLELCHKSEQLIAVQEKLEKARATISDNPEDNRLAIDVLDEILASLATSDEVANVQEEQTGKLVNRLPEGDPTEDNYAELFMNNHCALQRQMEELTHDISEKQRLLLEHNGTQASVASVITRQQYENDMRDLNDKIDTLQKERDELQRQQRGTQNSGAVSERRRKRIDELETELREMTKALKDLKQLQTMKAQSEQTIKKLQGEIQQMKQKKVQLMNDMRKESEKFRRYRMESEKRVMHLQQSERRQKLETKRIKAELEKQMVVYKRKYEQAQAASRRLEQQAARQNQALQQKFQNAELNERDRKQMRAFMEKELSYVVELAHARVLKDELVQQRAELCKRKRELEQLREDDIEGTAEPALKKQAVSDHRVSINTSGAAHTLQAEIEAVDAEIQSRSTQIEQLNRQIVAVSVDDRDDGRWARITSLPQAKVVLKDLFALAEKARSDLSEVHAQLDDLKTERSRVVQQSADERRAAEERCRALERSLREANERCVILESECCQNQAFLIRQLGTVRQDGSYSNVDMEKIRSIQANELAHVEELAKKLKETKQQNSEMELEISKMMTQGRRKSTGYFPRVTAEQRENAATSAPILDNIEEEERDDDVGGGTSTNARPRRTHTTTVYTALNGRLVASKEPVTFESPMTEEEDEASMDDRENDPDYRETPVHVPLKPRISAVGVKACCQCTTSCNTNKCGCKKQGRRCGAACSCAGVRCANRFPDLPPDDPVVSLVVPERGTHQLAANATFSIEAEDDAMAAKETVVLVPHGSKTSTSQAPVSPQSRGLMGMSRPTPTKFFNPISFSTPVQPKKK